MDPLQNGNNCEEEEEEEESQCPEEEEVDPRIQEELEKLNQSTDDINRWESELEDCRQRFRAVLVEASVKLDEQVKKIGRAVDDSKPYWEARKVARQAQVEAQKATQEFQRAVEFLRAAKETIALAEERLLEEDSRQFDSAWQEMLNHATQRVMGAEQERTRSEAEHKKTAASYNSCITHMKQLEKKLKRSINKSRPYFELKAKYYLQLEQFKGHVDERQAKLVVAKSDYRAALRSLESISEEIHAQRRSLAIGTREQGVGAEVDGGHEDIANFKMESDGLSMVSVSIEEEGSHSSSSEEEIGANSPSSPRASPSSSSSQPSTSTPLDGPCSHTSSPHNDPSSFLSSSPSSPSSSVHSSSCPDGLDLASPCSSNDPDSAWGSGHASPLLGPRSQCSGASSPDCDQERGERAEGAEATLEAGLNKLTLTVAQKQEEGDTGEEQDPHLMNPEMSSPSSVLLLNSV
ncbi:SH3 domain-binding protein 5-like [Gymnodraco acuticeps]|uniref:SH3 domain-binding protein 5 n=1 Tax=Gymnodraco acuticeps TaxID=8218 RepID=A0A6P8VK98_GYMAC|nr:SH3 domain-binding protein 5-like [Gymnodraco acuticeps]